MANRNSLSILSFFVATLSAQNPIGEVYLSGPAASESIAVSSRGVAYVTGANGLFRLKDSRFERIDEFANFGSPISVAFQSGSSKEEILWIGTSRGLWSHNGTSFVHHEEVPETVVYEVVAGPEGLLLLSVGDRYLSHAATNYLARTENGKILALGKIARTSRFGRPAFDRSGNIYLSSGEKPYFIAAQGIGNSATGAASMSRLPAQINRLDSPTPFHFASDGTDGTWAITGGQLLHYRKGKFEERFRDPTVLPLSGVGPQICLCGGQVWFISQTQVLTLRDQVFLKLDPGPATRPAVPRGVACDSQDNLWIALTRGVQVVPLKHLIAYSQLMVSTTQVPVHVRVQIDAEAWQVKNTGLRNLPFGNHTIRVDAGVPLLLQPNTTKPVQYRFRLRGVEEQWRVDANGQATFQVSQPGHYRLEADIERNGKWSDEPAFFEFQVDSRPFPLWAWPIALALLAGLVYIWRLRRLESKWGITSTTLGQRYLIKEKIAETNLSLVFRALDIKLAKRPVALKVIRRSSVERRALGTFRREVEALSRLRHRGIVAIQDVGLLGDGRPFLVMELVEGISLRSLLVQGPIVLERCIRILEQLGQTIAIAHQEGILHRDLKPENLMLEFPNTEREVLVVLDFGTARIVSDGDSVDSIAGGTIDYMAPEQLFGHSSKRTDVYSCGLVVFEMLTGKRLTDLMCENPQEVNQALQSALADVEPSLSPNAIRLIMQATNPDPDKRPDAIGEWAQLLVSQLRGADMI